RAYWLKGSHVCSTRMVQADAFAQRRRTLLMWYAGFLRNFCFISIGCCSLLAQQTSTTLTASSGSAILGQPVTLTATISPAPASGSAIFYDGVSILGTRPLSAGHATLTTTLLPFGSHAMKA